MTTLSPRSSCCLSVSLCLLFVSSCLDSTLSLLSYLPSVLPRPRLLPSFPACPYLNFKLFCLPCSVSPCALSFNILPASAPLVLIHALSFSLPALLLVVLSSPLCIPPPPSSSSSIPVVHTSSYPILLPRFISIHSLHFHLSKSTFPLFLSPCPVVQFLSHS